MVNDYLSVCGVMLDGLRLVVGRQAEGQSHHGLQVALQ